MHFCQSRFTRQGAGVNRIGAQCLCILWRRGKSALLWKGRLKQTENPCRLPGITPKSSSLIFLLWWHHSTLLHNSQLFIYSTECKSQKCFHSYITKTTTSRPLLHRKDFPDGAFSLDSIPIQRHSSASSAILQVSLPGLFPSQIKLLHFPFNPLLAGVRR